MLIQATSLPGAALIEPEARADERGSFARVYCEREFAARGLPSRFDERQARAIAWREAAPAGWAQDCLLDARRRLNFA